MGLFGIRPDQAQGRDRAAALRVPLAEPSVVSEVIQRKETYRGPLDTCPATKEMLEGRIKSFERSRWGSERVPPRSLTAYGCVG